MARLEKDIPKWMQEASVPGLTAAMIRNGKIVWSHHFGISNADTKKPVTDETIFEAASLSKIVTAYTAMKLIDAGKLNLDTPLNKYLGNNYDVGDDKRINLITARHVLTHSAGFPNWRPRNSALLPINSTPGEKFSYSGEGFVYLSRVMEHITGLKFEDLVKKEVFVPLGMNNSSFELTDAILNRKIYRHNWLGDVSYREEGRGANAAASLHTTAKDYARFVIALLNGKDLQSKTWKEMMTPQIKVDAVKSPEVSWGLGLGLETTTEGKYFWHWGDQGDSKCYVTADLERKNAIVYFTNGSNGLFFADEMLQATIDGTHPAIAWLDYGKADAAAKPFFKAILANGAVKAIKDYTTKRSQPGGHTFSESQINTMGYALLNQEKVEDAIELFKLNTIDFPNSSNTWDSLAEVYMVMGNKELAIEYYEKSLQLDPGNSNAVEQLKKLKS